MNIFFILHSNINSHFSLCLSRENNRISHIYNGNIFKKGGIKLVHINKGNSNFENKIDDINLLLDTFKPNILSIQEANFDDSIGLNFKGYNI